MEKSSGGISLKIPDPQPDQQNEAKNNSTDQNIKFTLDDFVLKLEPTIRRIFREEIERNRKYDLARDRERRW